MTRKYFTKTFTIKLRKVVLLSLIGMFITIDLFSAKQIHPTSNVQQLPYNNFIFHTFPSNYHYRATRSIIRDYKGLMWFGTENGLVRFDGINLKVYEHDSNSPRSISNNIVNALFEDSKHNLWIGTTKGLNLYNRAYDNFEKLDTISDETALLNLSYISSITAISDSVLCIGTFEQGLFCLNINSKQSRRYRLITESGTNFNITCIQPETNRQLWVGTQTGLLYFDIETGRFTSFFKNRNDLQSISSNVITSIKKDIYGNIWVGTQDTGLNLGVKSGNTFKFEPINSNSAKVRISSKSINKLLADEEGYLWIGTENEGLQQLEIRSGEVVVYTHDIGNSKSIGSNSIWSIYRDVEGRIWTGSYNKGISVHDACYSKFEGFQMNPYSVNGLINNDVRGFCESKDGKIWVATDGGGISRFDLQSRVFDRVICSGRGRNALNNNSIQSIICDSGDEIWVGTWGGGVDRLTQNGTLIKNYKIEGEEGIGNNKIRTIYQDQKGNIWAGTNGSGLFRYNKNKDQFELFVYKDLLIEKSYITSIQSGSGSTLWIGTLSGLIFLKFDEKRSVVQSKSFTINNSAISSNGINSIYIDRNENIWLGTNAGGVNILDPRNGTFKVIGKKNGLCSNSISGISEDNDGNFWITTNAGISKVDKETGEIIVFTTEDGLNSNEFYSKSCFKASNGALLFGSVQGFNLIDPQNIRTNHFIPNIILSGLKINNAPVEIALQSSPLSQQLSETDTLILNYKQTSFSIDFVALNYTRPNQNQFAYILEGYDDHWIYNGSKTTAHYTRVKPGKYTFKVKGSNNDGKWNEVPTTLYIVIEPPLWRTNWAYVLYLICFFVINMLIFRAWQERAHIRNQLKNEKQAKDRERELKERNLNLFTNISHEFRTPLTLIIGTTESLIDSFPLKMNEQLRVIQKNSHRLLSLTNSLMDLRKLEDGGLHLNVQEEDIIRSTENILTFFRDRINKQKIYLSVSYPETSRMFWFDNEKYTTIMINLLSNAIKNTPVSGSIRIALRHDVKNDLLEISVINTGIGIQPTELPFVFDKFYQTSSGKSQKGFGSGIGLTLSKGLVELHGGKIGVSSTPGHETNFSFTISIKKPDFESTDLLADHSVNFTFDNFIDDYEREEIIEDKYENADERPIVLIVEDNVDLRLFLKKELETYYKVILTENGEKGLQKANETIPDLIISDVVMPVMNGLDLCKTIKKDVKTSHIPFVLLTAKTTTEEQVEGLDCGADAYITKPFHLKLLHTQIANLIQSRKELYAKFSQDVYILSRKQSNNELDQIFLQKTIDYILENITDSKLDIDDLAQVHNMSHRNFYRKLKALTDTTVVEFIKTIRLKQAIQLIEMQQYNMSEISYMTGFSSPSYFTKSFREFYGKPPSDYLGQ
jgi:signal transduction histidine kinase/ligand-binding sensor domain-containing protein/DNA-binding response OmpR family regulator